MYVRLAFAVAAHLESEILIVDEVLAVGDAEFQKKCLGKMGEISKGEGRTVLFVSHNMAAVENLCSKGLVLKNGTIIFDGLSNDAINFYFNQQNNETKKTEFNSKFVEYVDLLNDKNDSITEVGMGEGFTLSIKTKGIKNIPGINVGFFINDIYGQKISAFSTAMKSPVFEENNRSEIEIYTFKISNPCLLEGKYFIDISIAYKKGGRLEYIENACAIEVLSRDIYGNGVLMNSYFGKIFLDVNTTVKAV